VKKVYTQFYNLLLFLFLLGNCKAQTYVFAQLNGSPINTANWNLSGSAYVGNIMYNNNSEVIVCPVQDWQTGAIFYNQPINLSQCSSWTAEFDFRIYDGSGADGLAFCFLDTPPSGYVVGGGMGIPATANGLKVCFDQNPNCAPYDRSDMPKIEIRWGTGYDECWNQPTIDNSNGALSFIRENAYNHAKITYNSGNINVYVNDTLYLSGFQQFNFTGYLGFTASTGALDDNHSIRNVVVYTNMPTSVAGTNRAICSGQSIQIGTNSNSSYVYNWFPSSGLNDAAISDPVVNIINTTGSILTEKYFVTTAFDSTAGCTSQDSITITVMPQLIVRNNITSVCAGNYYVFPSGKKVNTAGIYADTIKNSAGCDSLITNVNLTIDPPKITNLNATICNGTYYTFPSGKKVNETGTYLDTLTTPIGCDSIISLNLTVTVPETVNVSGVICNGSYTLPSGQIVTDAGTYSDTLKNMNGCDSIITIIELTKDESQMNSTFSVCKDSTANISPGNNFTDYVWNTGASTSVINVSQGTYSVSAIDVYGCNINDTFQIGALQPPPVALDKDIVLCIGQSKTIDAGAGYTSYLWNTGSTDQTINISSTGIYWVTVKDITGCPGSDTTIVDNVEQPPSDFLPADTFICSNFPVKLDSKNVFSTYLWNTGSTNKYITVTKPGIYSLTISDINDCIATDSTIVKDSACKEAVYVPSAFTPNGDGKNDIFKPVIFGIVLQYQFLIYNRWGQKVFESNNPSAGWDGTLNSAPQQSGTFIWQLQVQLNGESLIKESGTLVLIR
jgi:gliding motility-associated-like protein